MRKSIRGRGLSAVSRFYSVSNDTSRLAEPRHLNPAWPPPSNHDGQHMLPHVACGLACRPGGHRRHAADVSLTDCASNLLHPRSSKHNASNAKERVIDAGSARFSRQRATLCARERGCICARPSQQQSKASRLSMTDPHGRPREPNELKQDDDNDKGDRDTPCAHSSDDAECGASTAASAPATRNRPSLTRLCTA